MPIFQTVRCPNCGNFAERRLLIDYRVPASDRLMQTECPSCDYLMVMSLPDGRVLEAYAPGQFSHNKFLNPFSRLLVHPT